MKVLRKAQEIPVQDFERCHDGVGTLQCLSLLDGLGSDRFPFMHHDTIKAGVTIEEHPHVNNEEIYYLFSGKGTLVYDGAEYPMEAGDVSVCLVGHSHGFIALEDCVLIVVGSR